MYKLSGRVIKGDGYGKVLGFPTANLDRRDYSRKRMNIRLGIYAGFAELNLKSKILNLKSAIVIGPVDKIGLPKIEAHLLGFKGNLYGSKISLFLVKYLRGFKRFKTVKILKQQITNDIRQVKKLKF